MSEASQRSAGRWRGAVAPGSGGRLRPAPFRRALRVLRVVEFCLRKVRRPIPIILHYLRRTSPAEVRFRDGTVISLSSHPHDIVTVMVVFCFKDYGEPSRGSVVIDVGANIGAYTIFAACAGASAVAAYEPNPEAHRTLLVNIAANNLTNVTAYHAGVGASDGTGTIAQASSPYNRMCTDGADGIAVAVHSISRVVSACGAARVGMLKLDCEGAEYEIVRAISAPMASKIERIRMEYEPDQGDVSVLIAHLKSLGYSTELLSAAPNRLWAVRDSFPGARSVNSDVTSDAITKSD